ncbi:hypothetical protein Hanom_Chr10g00894591 [Helianthus anomalus]
MCGTCIFTIWICILILKNHKLSLLLQPFCFCLFCFWISNSFKILFHSSSLLSIIFLKSFLSILNIGGIRKFLSEFLFKFAPQIINHAEQ